MGITVFAPSSWVTIGDDCPATVRQVCLTTDGVTYECVWWEGRERKIAWLADYEVRQHDKSLVKKEIHFAAHG